MREAEKTIIFGVYGFWAEPLTAAEDSEKAWHVKSKCSTDNFWDMILVLRIKPFCYGSNIVLYCLSSSLLYRIGNIKMLRNPNSPR